MTITNIHIQLFPTLSFFEISKNVQQYCSYLKQFHCLPNSFITRIVLQTNSITLQGMHHYNDVLETFGRQMPKALVMPIIQGKKKPKKKTTSSESKLVQTYPSNSRPSAAKSLSLIKGKQLKELLYFTTNQSIPFFYKMEQSTLLT